MEESRQRSSEGVTAEEMTRLINDACSVRGMPLVDALHTAEKHRANAVT